MNFTINCTLQLNGTKIAIECKVDGPTAVLPYNTTCQINDQPPEKCKLSIAFLGPIKYQVADKIASTFCGHILVYVTVI